MAYEQTLRDAPHPRDARHTTVRVPRAGRTAPRTGSTHRVPQASARRPGAAMVKVVGWRHGRSAVVATLEYALERAAAVSDGLGPDQVRDDLGVEPRPEAPAPDRIEEEFDGATAVAGSSDSVPRDANELIADWGLDDESRRRAAVHIVLSLPQTDARVEWEAGMRAVAEMFPNHPHLAILHTDTQSPHIHVVVRATGYDGSRLDIRKDDLHRMRETLARHGRDVGVHVEARRYRMPQRAYYTKAPHRPDSPRAGLDRALSVLTAPFAATRTQVIDAARTVATSNAMLTDKDLARCAQAANAVGRHPRYQEVARPLFDLAAQRVATRTKAPPPIPRPAPPPRQRVVSKTPLHTPVPRPSHPPSRASRHAAAEALKRGTPLTEAQRQTLAQQARVLAERGDLKAAMTLHTCLRPPPPRAVAPLSKTPQNAPTRTAAAVVRRSAAPPPPPIIRAAREAMRRGETLRAEQREAVAQLARYLAERGDLSRAARLYAYLHPPSPAKAPARKVPDPAVSKAPTRQVGEPAPAKTVRQVSDAPAKLTSPREDRTDVQRSQALRQIADAIRRHQPLTAAQREALSETARALFEAGRHQAALTLYAYVRPRAERSRRTDDSLER